MPPKQKFLRSFFPTACFQPTVILSLIILIHFSAKCSSTLNPRTGWDGERTALENTRASKQTPEATADGGRMSSNRKLHGEISTNKGPDLTAGRGETGLVFMCERKPGHTVKKVRGNQMCTKSDVYSPNSFNKCLQCQTNVFAGTRLNLSLRDLSSKVLSLSYGISSI